MFTYIFKILDGKKAVDQNELLRFIISKIKVSSKRLSKNAKNKRINNKKIVWNFFFNFKYLVLHSFHI